jgi:hypothetical protein
VSFITAGQWCNLILESKRKIPHPYSRADENARLVDGVRDDDFLFFKNCAPLPKILFFSPLVRVLKVFAFRSRSQNPCHPWQGVAPISGDLPVFCVYGESFTHAAFPCYSF